MSETHTAETDTADGTAARISPTPSRRAGRLAALVPPPGPGRIVYWSTFINMTGTGMYLTSSALFFVHYLGLSATRVTAALTVSGLIGLVAGIPIGRLTDRRGARGVYLVTLTAEAVTMAALPLARGFAQFAALVTLTSLASAASISARGPLIRAAAGDRPTRLRAQIRSATNTGIALGGAVTAVALAANTRTAYLLLVLGNAASFALCALVAARLPSSGPVGSAALPDRWQALRDRPYLAVVGVNAVIMLQYPVLTLVLPLWLLGQAGHEGVPRWAVATVVPLNTLMVALLQVRMSRSIDSPGSAARLMPRAGAFLLGGFALMAIVPGLKAAAAVPVLAAAVIVFTLGEILTSTVGYELSFELAPAAAQGQYMGVYTFGGGIGRVLSPTVAGFLCLSLGRVGWIVFGLVFLAVCLPTPRIAAWAQRETGRRQAEAETV